MCSMYLGRYSIYDQRVDDWWTLDVCTAPFCEGTQRQQQAVQFRGTPHPVPVYKVIEAGGK